MDNVTVKEQQVVKDFGLEWDKFNFLDHDPVETKLLFDKYFANFPLNQFNNSHKGFDIGCGSGRWAKLVGQHVGRLDCIDASTEAIAVAKKNCSNTRSCNFINASATNLPLDNTSYDFGYSLGVLHHLQETEVALEQCANKLKSGAPFLLYLYYRFDNRSNTFKALWKASDLLRQCISKLPFTLKTKLTDLIAALIYFPLAKLSSILELCKISSAKIPLSFYRNTSFYIMRNDALDRFGTRLEKRYTKDEITAMLHRAGFEKIQFNQHEPYWVAVAWKK